jgi:hypothetical protein
MYHVVRARSLRRLSDYRYVPIPQTGFVQPIKTVKHVERARFWGYSEIYCVGVM